MANNLLKQNKFSHFKKLFIFIRIRYTTSNSHRPHTRSNEKQNLLFYSWYTNAGTSSTKNACKYDCIQNFSKDMKFNSKMSSNPKKNPKLKPDISNFYQAYIFLMLVPVGLAFAARWKYNEEIEDKRKEKEAYMKMRLPAVPLPKNLKDVDDMEYRKVTLKGEFLHNGEMLLNPRPKFKPIRWHKDGTYTKPEVSKRHGAQVITPFKLSNSNLLVLVNRGWVPKACRNPDERQFGQIMGEVEFDAVVLKTGKLHSWLDTKIPNRPNVFSQMNVEELSSFAGTLPLYFEATNTFEGGPIGRQTFHKSNSFGTITYLALSLASICTATFITFTMFA